MPSCVHAHTHLYENLECPCLQNRKKLIEAFCGLLGNFLEFVFFFKPLLCFLTADRLIRRGDRHAEEGDGEEARAPCCERARRSASSVWVS